jgi:hypothetical protein
MLLIALLGEIDVTHLGNTSDPTKLISLGIVARRDNNKHISN